ncbi:hypothetical protein ACHAXN_003427 [Cyclotella atomus]
MEYQQQQPSPHRNRPPKKPRDDHLRGCFEITPIPEEDSTSVICRYCNEYSKIIKRFNPTKARTHLVMHCPGVGDTMRRVLLEGSQEYKRLKRLGQVQDQSTNSTDTADNTIGDDDTDNLETTLNDTEEATDQEALTNQFINGNNNSNKPKPLQMKQVTQLYLHSEKRTLERHYMDMWKDCSRELARLRQELNQSDLALEVRLELEGDVIGLKRKKAEFARLLGMGVGVASTI